MARIYLFTYIIIIDIFKKVKQNKGFSAFLWLGIFDDFSLEMRWKTECLVEYCQRMYHDIKHSGPPAGRRSGRVRDDIVTFLISVIAGVVSSYICKWLDGDKYAVTA